MRRERVEGIPRLDPLDRIPGEPGVEAGRIDLRRPEERSSPAPTPYGVVPTCLLPIGRVRPPILRHPLLERAEGMRTAAAAEPASAECGQQRCLLERYPACLPGHDPGVHHPSKQHIPQSKGP